METNDSALLDASFALSVNLEVLVAASSALSPNNPNRVTPAAITPKTSPKGLDDATRLNSAIASFAEVIERAKEINALALSQAI